MIFYGQTSEFYCSYRNHIISYHPTYVGNPWYSGSCWSTGWVIDPAPGAWFKIKFISLAQNVPSPVQLYSTESWPYRPTPFIPCYKCSNIFLMTGNEGHNQCSWRWCNHFQTYLCLMFSWRCSLVFTRKCTLYVIINRFPFYFFPAKCLMPVP